MTSQNYWSILILSLDLFRIEFVERNIFTIEALWLKFPGLLLKHLNIEREIVGLYFNSRQEVTYVLNCYHCRQQRTKRLMILPANDLAVSVKPDHKTDRQTHIIVMLCNANESVLDVLLLSKRMECLIKYSCPTLWRFIVAGLFIIRNMSQLPSLINGFV